MGKIYGNKLYIPTVSHGTTTVAVEITILRKSGKVAVSQEAKNLEKNLDDMEAHPW